MLRDSTIVHGLLEEGLSTLDVFTRIEFKSYFRNKIPYGNSYKLFMELRKRGYIEQLTSTYPYKFIKKDSFSISDVVLMYTEVRKYSASTNKRYKDKQLSNSSTMELKEALSLLRSYGFTITYP